MSNRRARSASLKGRPRTSSGTRQGARPVARRRPLGVLALVAGTVVVLAAILGFALSRSNSSTPAAPTAIPSAGSTPGAILSAQPAEGIGVLDPSSGLAQAAPAPPKVGQPAPDFAWQTTTGRTTLSAMRGHAVLLEFFGVWCPACRRDVPLLNSLLNTYHAQGLQVLAVTGSPYGMNYETTGSEAPVNISDMALYRADYHPAYDEVLDPSNRVFNLYGRGTSFPTFYIIDAKGIVRFGTSLAINDSDLMARVHAAL